MISLSGPIKISIIADAKRAVSGFHEASTAAESLGTKVGKVGKFLGRVAFTGAVAGIAAVGAAAVVGVKDAISYEAAQKRAGAALKVNAGAAGQTIASLKAQAAATETLSGATFDENDVLDSQSRLLRVGIKGKQAFSAANLASANIAAATNTSIGAGAKVLAKALQDPTKAAGALRRSNIALNSSQQDQIKAFIKAGDTASAQGIILGAVNTQLAGQAASLGKGVGATFAIFKDTLQDTARDLAVQLLPALAAVATFISANLPAAIAFVSTAFGTIKDAVVPLIPSLDQVKAAFGAFVAVISNPVFQIFAAFIGGIAVAFAAYSAVVAVVTGVTSAFTAVQAALNLVLAANPIGLVILAIAGLVAAFIVAYKQSETFRNIVNAAFESIKAVAAAVWPVIQAIITTVIAVVSAAFAVFKAVILAVWSVVHAQASIAWAAIQLVISAVLAVVTLQFNIVKGVILAVWHSVDSEALAAFNAVRAVVVGVVSAVGSAFRSVVGVVVGVFVSVLSAVTDKMNAVRDRVTGALDAVRNAVNGIDLYAAGRALIGRLAEGVAAGAQAVVDKVSGMLSKVKGLLPGSPIKSGPLLEWNNVGRTGPGGQLMTRLAEGIRSQASAVEDALSGSLTGLTGSVVSSADVSALSVVPAPAAAVSAPAAPQRVVLPPPNQITNAEQGRAVVEQLIAYTKAYGPLSLVLPS